MVSERHKLNLLIESLKTDRNYARTQYKNGDDGAFVRMEHLDEAIAVLIEFRAKYTKGFS